MMYMYMVEIPDEEYAYPDSKVGGEKKRFKIVLRHL